MFSTAEIILALILGFCIGGIITGVLAIWEFNVKTSASKDKKS